MDIKNYIEGEKYNIQYRLLNDRIIFLNGEIEDNMANSIIAQLLLLEAEDNKKGITMYINSPGGVVTAGLAIYDTIKHIKSPVSTICIGQAASMAAVLLASGEKGKRFALPNSRIMIHQVIGGARGQLSDIEINLKEMKRLSEILNKILSESTGKTIKQIEKDTNRDYYMSSIEAKNYGLIDNVI